MPRNELSRSQRCRCWLAAKLRDGPRDIREVRQEAKAQGFRKSDLKAARAALGVETVHRDEETWLWLLPSSP